MDGEGDSKAVVKLALIVGIVTIICVGLVCDCAKVNLDYADAKAAKQEATP